MAGLRYGLTRLAKSLKCVSKTPCSCTLRQNRSGSASCHPGRLRPFRPCGPSLRRSRLPDSREEVNPLLGPGVGSMATRRGSLHEHRRMDGMSDDIRDLLPRYKSDCARARELIQRLATAPTRGEAICELDQLAREILDAMPEA